MWVFVTSAAVLLAAVAILAYPLVIQRLESYRVAHETSTSFSERDALLEAMSDLELDFRAGKITAGDYEREKARLQRAYLAAVDTEQNVDTEKDADPARKMHG